MASGSVCPSTLLGSSAWHFDSLPKTRLQGPFMDAATIWLRGFRADSADISFTL